MKDFSRTDDVVSEVSRLMAEPDSEIVSEARKRAEALTANPPWPGYQGSVMTELAFLIWQRAGMPMHPTETGFPLRTAELAETLDVVPSRIRQQVADLESAGLARKIGRDWYFAESAVDFLKKSKEKEVMSLRGSTPTGGKCTLKRMSGGKVQSGCSGLSQDEFDAYKKAAMIAAEINGGDWDRAKYFLEDAGFEVFME